MLLALLLLGVTLLAYRPAGNGEWLLDDDLHVTRPELRSRAGLARIWGEPGATQQYYPVLHTAFWLEHRMWGDSVAAYHLVNVLLHVTAAALLVPLSRRLGLAGGWWAAFLFALHPVCVESVAWIAEQKNTLSAVFAIGAVVAYLAFDDTRKQTWYGVAAGLFGLALLAKTATAVLPGVLLVLLWWRRGRLSWKRDLWPLVPWFGASAAAGVITFVLEQRLLAGIAANVAPGPSERCLTASRAFWFYLGKAIWPANLAFFYERWSVDSGGAWRYALVAFVVLAAILLLGFVRQQRGFVAALLIYGGALLPVLGFIDVEWFVFSSVADHFQYLALPALIVPLAAVGVRAGTRMGPGGRVAGSPGAAGLAAVCAFGVLTWRHSASFRGNVALYRDAVAHSPRSVVAHNHLGVALARDPARLPHAIAEFEQALALNPDAAETHANLGAALLRQPGRSMDAVEHFAAALRLKPTLGGVRDQLAVAHFDGARELAASGAASAAVAHYRKALRYDPAFAEAHYNLANLLVRDEQTLTEAIEHYEAAVRLKPKFVEAQTNLGAALVRMPGRLGDAIAHFEAALAAEPAYAPARNNLRAARALRAAAGDSAQPAERGVLPP